MYVEGSEDLQRSYAAGDVSPVYPALTLVACGCHLQLPLVYRTLRYPRTAIALYNHVPSFVTLPLPSIITTGSPITRHDRQGGERIPVASDPESDHASANLIDRHALLHSLFRDRVVSAVLSGLSRAEVFGSG